MVELQLWVMSTLPYTGYIARHPAPGAALRLSTAVVFHDQLNLSNVRSLSCQRHKLQLVNTELLHECTNDWARNNEDSNGFMTR